MAGEPFPLTPLEQLPLMIDHDAIEEVYLPFLLGWSVSGWSPYGRPMTSRGKRSSAAR